MKNQTTKTKLNEGPMGGLHTETEDGIFHISRCQSCGRLLTKLEIVGRLDAAHAGGEWRGACLCGASRFSPSYPRGLEWLSPRVIRMALAVLKGQVAPGVSR